MENYDQIYKMIIIGDSGVGKSNIMTRYLKNEFRTDSKSTVGVEFGTKKLSVGGIDTKLQIWDTAGQERYRSITSSYYKGSKGCFIVYDITNEASFQNVEKWFEETKRSAEKNVSVVLVGNKCDLEQERKIPKEKGEERAQILECPFFETSALSNINIEAIFQAMADNIFERGKKNKEGGDDLDDDDYEIVAEGKQLDTNTKDEKKGCNC